VKTRCDGIKDLLIEYIEGELSSGDARAVEEHLDECENCAAECAALRRTYMLLRDDGYAEPSPFFWTRFNARIRARRREASAFGAGRWGALAPRLAPVMAAVVCFGIGMWLGLRPGPEPAGYPAAPLRVTGMGRGTPLAASPTAVLPVVSARSKYLVDSGAIEPSFTPAADTLRPETFDPFGGEARMRLATFEREAYRMPETERLPGEPRAGE